MTISDKGVFQDLEPVEDKAYRIAEAVSSIVPMGSAVFKALFSPPIEARYSKWMASVTEAINYLIDKQKIPLDELQNNSQFVDFVLYLSQSAIKTSKEEKLKYLKFAVINSALYKIDDQDEYNYFLFILDQMTSTHIKVLLACDGVAGNIDAKATICSVFGDYENKKYIYDQVFTDLVVRGLIIARPDKTHVQQVYRSITANKFIKLFDSHNL